MPCGSLRLQTLTTHQNFQLSPVSGWINKAPDPHPEQPSLPKTKASLFPDLNCSFPDIIFGAVSHPGGLSPFPLRSGAVSVGSRQGARLSWQQGGRKASCLCLCHSPCVSLALISPTVSSATWWQGGDDSPGL